MSTRLCWWPASNGERIELHQKGSLLQVQRICPDGSGGAVVVNTLRAQDHYELATRIGHVDRAFPFPCKAVAYGQAAIPKARAS